VLLSEICFLEIYSCKFLQVEMFLARGYINHYSGFSKYYHVLLKHKTKSSVFKIVELGIPARNFLS
jgi:hypothetical protein